MLKRFFLFLSSLFIITWFAAACSSGMKMVNRENYGTATLTPFLSKATFTSVYNPLEINEDAEVIQPSITETTDQTLLEETNQVEIDGQASYTPSLTPATNESPLWVSATPTLATPSSTPNLPFVTNTPKPTTATSAPGATSVPTETSAPTETPMPTATPVNTSTPVPTNTLVPTATAIPVGCSFSGNAAYENQVVVLINQERTDRGLSALSSNSSLTSAARGHSEDMACNDFFSHTGSDGSSMVSRILAAGYSYSWVAENIAASSSCSFSASSVVNMWMNSAGHKANILSANAVHIGVGFRCVNDGASGDLDAYYTANFGRP